MRKQLAIFIIITALLCLVIYFDTKQKPQNIENPSPISIIKIPVPNVSMTSVLGEKLELRKMESEIVLLNFWASWCRPCVEEFPDMIQLVKREQGRITLIAVSVDDKKEKMEEFLAKQKINNNPNIHIVWDETKDISFTQFNTLKLPETIVIKNKMMVKKIVGQVKWLEEDL